MLIKLTGSKNGKPVLIETAAIIFAEETTDVFQNDIPYTRVTLRPDGQGHDLTVGIDETCDDILEKIEESEDQFYE